MIQDLHTEIDRLKRRIKLCERVTLGSLVGICVSVKFGHQEWIGLLFLILFCQISKLVFKRKLKQKEYLVKEVEERTQEIRSEKDAIQEESEKLAAALKALGEAQDELVRKERMATVGQLTQGLVDRILNPLNYINNFANLTSGLAKDLRENLDSQKEHLKPDVYDDSVDLLNMMTSNLEKISEHGFNTVRIVKAMEELLKDRRGNLTLTNINGLCRIALDKLKKTYEQDIPGMDGVLDFTESLTGGDVKYKIRTLTLEFETPEQDYYDWGIRISEIANYLAGRKYKIILDNDPDFYYIGRLNVEVEKSDRVEGTLTLSGSVDPYKYEKFSSLENWEWDTFNFRTGIIRNYKDIVVDGTYKLVIPGRRKRIVPVISCNTAIQVSYDGVIYNLSPGKNKVFGICIKEGENILTFSGKATISVDYRGGLL